MRISFLILMIVLPTLVYGASGDWPQWRGPNRDALSTETGLLRQWDSPGPPLEWKASGLGRGYSSIALADGRIYTMGDRGNQQFVIGLDARNGRELWATAVGKPWNDGGPRCTPTVDGDMVYAITPVGDLVCLDARTGKGIWTKNFARDFQGRMMSGWGYCESPLIEGPNLICSPGGDAATIVALNKKTGKPVWSCAVPDCGGAAYSSAVISEAGGIKQYVQLVGRGIVGVAAKDGKLLWNYKRVANGTANIPTPIVQDDYIFCSTGYQTGAALLKLEKRGSGINAREVYFLPSNKLQNHHGGMVLIGDHVYCGHGHNNGFPICVEMATGNIAWSQGRGPGRGSAAIVAADGHLYFRYENGLMALIEATPEGYREKGTFQIPDSSAPSWPHPVIAFGKLYLREQDALLCYSLKASR
jgi:outer membrane protein assembly factor BamB